MDFDYIVFVGRFEPFHNGHAVAARHALRSGRKLIILIGSAGTPRTIRNPWSVTERSVMIRSALEDVADRLILRPLRDHLYNEAHWVAAVQREVLAAIRDDGDLTDARVGIVGLGERATSHYPHEFPQWPKVEVERTETPSATELRHHLFEAADDVAKDALRILRANVPTPVFETLEAFRKSSTAYRQLVDEHHFIKEYRAGWADAPYPPIFVTTDAVVVHSGHALLVRRRSEPGKGLWALPGGFVRGNESLLECCLRELREETRLKIPVPVLKGSIKGSHVFDHPDRSLRGRTITHAFHFDFPTGELPRVRGGDDAEKAHWFPISEALDMSSQLYEDHLHILEFFLGRT